MERPRPETLAYRTARRIVVATVGTTLLAIGAILLVTPGPAIVVLALGLAVLGLEFAWARRWLHKLRTATGSLVARVRRSAADDAPPD